MNHLNGVEIAWDIVVSLHRSMFYAQRLQDGVLNHFAERWWATKTISMFKMGYEIFSNDAKLYSAVVPRNKSDCSLSSQCTLQVYHKCKKCLCASTLCSLQDKHLNINF